MGVRGKFYWELDVTAGTGGGLDFGIVRSDQTQWMDGTLSNRLFNQPEFSGLLGNSGSIRSKTGTDSDVSNYLSATANGILKHSWYVLMPLKVNCGLVKMECGVKMEVGNPALGLNPGASNLFTDTRFSYLPVMMGASDSGTSTTVWNFGQKPFKFAPPDGFQPLNNANTRPETVISRPDQYVGMTTYTGAGGTKKVDGLKFSPDLIWVKGRDSSLAPTLGDSVRGFGETKMLSPSVTAEEDRGTDPTDGSERGYISAKHNSGFTVVDGTGSSQVNGSGEDYVAWCLRDLVETKTLI